MHRWPLVQAVTDVAGYTFFARNTRQHRDKAMISPCAMHGGCKPHNDGSNATLYQAEGISRVGNARMRRRIGLVFFSAHSVTCKAKCA